MDPGQTVGRLTRLGLTSYEARAYLALTGRDSFTAAEVAARAELPRQRIYDVLGGLVLKGLVSTRPGSVVKYAAGDPTPAIGRLLAEHRSRLDDMEREARVLIDQLTPAYRAGQEQSDPLEYIEVLRSPGAINARFDALQAAVKRELLIFTRPPYAKAPQDNLAGLAVARAHSVRSLYEFSLFADPAASAGVRRFIEEGEDARFVSELPLKLVIIDEAIVMFGMQDPIAGRADLTMMVVEHPALAVVLKAAFEAYWERGVSFAEARAASGRSRSSLPARRTPGHARSAGRARR
ncbi:MAG TPA: helix-turn-helix domain-containing protein [Candidatus Limnocylindrales bacterium]|nr:helix-turn-helix domain-containing protein [Candidatus Limnocylindrales bacterium]